MDIAVPGGGGATGPGNGSGEGPGNGPGAWLTAALDGNAPVLVRIGLPDATADLEAALEGIDPVRCAVVRVGNPLKAPLDPQRVMLQLAPHDVGGSGPGWVGGDEAGRLLRTVVDRAAGRPSLLVVVEQAETLTPAALALLRLLPGLRGAGVPSIRVAFYGTPAFRALLDDAPVRPVRDHDGATLPPPSPLRPARRYRRGAVLGVAAVAVTVLLFATHLPFRGTSPVSGVPVAPASPSLPPAAAAAPVPAAQAAPAAGTPAAVPPDVAPQPRAAAAAPSTPPPPTVESPVAARARLFREFNAFVEARGLAGRLSRSEREALFEEYLVRRSVATGAMVSPLGAPGPSTVLSTSAAAAATDPASLPATAPEVVVFFRAGRAGAEARAGESAVLLRQWAAEVTVRPAPDGPAEPTVRYYRPEDRSLALSLAFALPPATPDWQLVDLSGAADRPVRPTIEVWLPGAP